MKRVAIVFLILVFLPFITAYCSESQIDINSASLSELDEITYIGPATAQKIIDFRPFDSIDELIEISGIGDIKLQVIKEQGLACVKKENVEQEKEEEIKEEEGDENKYNEDEDEKESKIEEIAYENDSEETKINQLEVIKLNSKDIKTENNSENNIDSDKNKHSKYGFVVFCLLLAILFIIKKWE